MSHTRVLYHTGHMLCCTTLRLEQTPFKQSYHIDTPNAPGSNKIKLAAAETVWYVKYLETIWLCSTTTF